MIRCPAYGADAFKIEAARGECKATCGRTARARRLGSAVWRGARDAHARRRRGERTHARRSSVARARSRLPRAAAGPGRRAARQRGRGRGRRIVPRVERHARWRSDEAAQQGRVRRLGARRSEIMWPRWWARAASGRRHAMREARSRGPGDASERRAREGRPQVHCLRHPRREGATDAAARRIGRRQCPVPRGRVVKTSRAWARRRRRGRQWRWQWRRRGDGDDAAAARRRHPPARGAAAQPARR